MSVRGSCLMATLTYASHVESFDGGRYKRPLSSNIQPSIPAKRLSVPTGNNQKQPPFPGTTARPDQRVNVRVPVTRACFSRLVPGQVAFVNRHFGKNHVGAATGPGGVSHIASLEELNDMLSRPENHVNKAARLLFRGVGARSMYRPVDGGGFKKLTFQAFDSRAEKGAPVPDAMHPIHQFALDGLVATRVEDVDDIDMSGSAFSQQLCTVGVKGHCPMLISAVPGDVHRGVRESLSGSIAQASTTYLKPARILSKVYVVLVAVQVDDSPRRWKLQYETVSSSNIDVDPRFSHGQKLFRTDLGKPGAPFKGRRIVLRVMELGTVVDTKFGPAERPQLVVCVHVTPFEPTKIVDGVVDTNPVSFRAPLDVWETFSASATPKQDKARAMAAPKHSGLKRLQSGARPVVTGVNAADVAQLRQALLDMKVALDTLQAQVRAGNLGGKQERKALDKKLQTLKNEIKAGNIGGKRGRKAIEDKITKFAESQEEIYGEASEFLVRTRVIELIRMRVSGNPIEPDELSQADQQLLQFADEIVKEFDLDADSEPFDGPPQRNDDGSSRGELRRASL